MIDERQIGWVVANSEVGGVIMAIDDGARVAMAHITPASARVLARLLLRHADVADPPSSGLTGAEAQSP